MFTSKCASCTDTVGDGPECSICKKRFHFACGGITERGFTRLGSGRSSWMCAACRDASQPGSETLGMETTAVNTPGRSKFSSGLQLELGTGSTSTSTPKQGPIDETNQSPSFLMLLNEVSSKITSMEAEMKRIRIIQQDLQQVKSDVANLSSAVNERLDLICARVDDVEARLSAAENLRAEVDELKSQVKLIQEEGYKNDQWVRRSNIQINGIPHKHGENLIKIVKTLADRSGFSLNTENDIDFVTRVAVKNDIEGRKNKPIVLKLHSRYKKDDFLASLRKLRDIKACDIGFVGSAGRIYFNDHLSSRNKHLFQQAKLKAKEKNYTFCWVRNCTVMVRKSEKSPIIHITSDESLKKIV